MSEAATRANPRRSETYLSRVDQRRRLVPGLVLGVGLGGFVDGIVLHQLLQWHHMVSSQACCPTSTQEGLEENTLADGLFHSVTWLITLAGSIATVRAWRNGRLAPSWQLHAGALIAGWGTFNLLDSINHLLGIHHIRDDIGGPIAWDIGFFLFALVLMAVGHTMIRQARAPFRRAHSGPLAPRHPPGVRPCGASGDRAQTCTTSVRRGVVGRLARLGSVLSIGKLAGGPNAGRYYVEQVAQGREDYYSGEGEAPGAWAGSGAAALGLSGEVDEGGLERLLRSEDPATGDALRRPVAEGAVAGFDLTFRAPKSVGVLWGVAEADVASQVQRGHEAAVAGALRYLEREACRARRGAGGKLQVRGDGFVAAAFRHRASRAGDPLLHTHVVVGNATRGPDGRWTALDGRELYRHAKTAGFLYQGSCAPSSASGSASSGTRSKTGAQT